MRLGVVGMLPSDLQPATASPSEENRTLGLTGSGVTNMLPNDFRTFTTPHFEAIRALGFTGFGHHFGPDPSSVTEGDCERARSVWEGLGLDLAQFALLYPECLFDSDNAVRRAVIARIKAGNRVARLLRAGAHLIRPGSLNPAGSWTPHPDNHRPECLDRFVASLREIADDAEANGVTVVVESHVVSIMRSPEVCAEVVDRVGSPRIRIVLDPVNHFESIDQAFHSTERLRQIFDILGPIAPIGHAKDLRVGNDLVTHLEEAVPGEGILDYTTLLTRFQQANPDGYLLIEHIPPSKVPIASAYIRHVAEEVGVEIR